MLELLDCNPCIPVGNLLCAAMCGRRGELPFGPFVSAFNTLYLECYPIGPLTGQVIVRVDAYGPSLAIRTDEPYAGTMQAPTEAFTDRLAELVASHPWGSARGEIIIHFKDGRPLSRKQERSIPLKLQRKPEVSSTHAEP